MAKKYFGTDGIRGEVGKGVINVEFMLQLGWAIGSVFKQSDPATILIGRDPRHSGIILQSALQAGLAAAGVNCHLLDVMPTPAVAYLTQLMDADAGVVITASHNPYLDNGVKLFDSRGMKLSDELEQEIEAQLDLPVQDHSAYCQGRIETVIDAADQYIAFCKSIFAKDLNLSDYKIVLDCANGAAYKIAPQLLRELGAEVVTIHDQPDGFNINVKCGATHLQSLQHQVVAVQADLGIAFDGDADRVMMVDASGEVVDGDQILYILAQHEQRANGVVGTLMSNLGLEQALQHNDIEFVRAQVGDRYVLAQLLANGWTLGGESSGHILNLDLTTTGDGILTALQILSILFHTGSSLRHLLKQLVMHPQVMVNVPVYDGFDLDAHLDIKEKIAKIANGLGSDGRVLVRPSGTQPLVRVMAEGRDEKQIRQVVAEIVDYITQVLTFV